jgi:hypothetical protein
MSDNPLIDTAQAVSQTIPLSVGASLFIGIPVTDWLLIFSLIIALLNIGWFGVRFYDRFIQKDGRHDSNTNSTERDSS